ncbi:MAG: hypothetical protein JNG85_03195, partial [Spirochaetaceae bacterium]|nr:hypothetical protein [Spirochaetaceae bacterium]
TSIILGAAYDSTESDSRRVKNGVKAEASGEWGPGALNAGFGPTDFHRFTLKAAAYQPLFSVGQAGNPELNLFSAYLAGFASFDYAGGDAIPLYVRQSFGGRDLRDSLGDCVRGYPSRSYDAALKTVANGEVRLVGPALFNTPWLVPIVYGFCDAGYYAGFPESSAKAEASGTILSAGGGFALDVLDFAYIGVSLGSKFPGSDALYAVYGETDAFFFSVEFLLHF